MSRTVALHYIKLVLRSILFFSAVIAYIINRIRNSGEFFGGRENDPILLGTVWLFFVTEMVFRFFPVKLESMGCQKQFSKNYQEIPGSDKRVTVQPGAVTFAVVTAWVVLNAIIGVLYYTHIIDRGILFLICLAYSVCDVICILFFCPFQTWFMRNKCCATCRIYNWDYAMMFTPLVFVPNIYTWSLLGIALVLVIKWEYLVHKHPERFSEKCNASLSCAKCQEKLCHHKKQLQKYLKKGRFNLKGNTLFGGRRSMPSEKKDKKEKDPAEQEVT